MEQLKSSSISTACGKGEPAVQEPPLQVIVAEGGVGVVVVVGIAVAATMSVGQKIAETLVLTGADIISVVVDSPADEVLMLQVCWQI